MLEYLEQTSVGGGGFFSVTLNYVVLKWTAFSGQKVLCLEFCRVEDGTDAAKSKMFYSGLQLGKRTRLTGHLALIVVSGA